MTALNMVYDKQNKPGSDQYKLAVTVMSKATELPRQCSVDSTQLDF